MKFQFIKNGKELKVNSADLPHNFLNVLYNNVYFSLVNQSMHGTAKHMTEKEGYINTIIQDERLIYIRDDNTGKYFSAGWQPIYSEYTSYDCISGLNYQIIETIVDDIKVLWRIYVPSDDDPIEIWDIKITNTGSKARKLSLFTETEINCEGVDLYCGALYRYAEYKPELNGIYVLQDAPRHEEIHFPWHNAFFSSNKQPDTWEASKEKFIGKRKTLIDPVAVTEGQCGNNYASIATPAGALHFKIQLEPGAEYDVRFIAGACDTTSMAQAINKKYLSHNLSNDPEFDKLAVNISAKMQNIQVELPDESLNNLTNYWVKQQMIYGAIWTRWGYKGYRDIVQHNQGVAILMPELAKQKLTSALKHQYQDGFALRGWHPLDPMRYADSSQWLISAITEYIKETGDTSFLDQVVPYLDQGQDTVYIHLKKSLERLHTDRGPRDMCLIFFGDWNDSLTGVCQKGKGESVWLSMAFCRCCLLLQELAIYLNKVEDAQLMQKWYQEMKEAINTNAWDGDWYMCAIDDDGNPIGSHSNEEGKIFLNMQSWAQLGKVCTDEQWEKSYKNVKKYLDSGWGLILNYPVYTKPQSNVGRLSYIRPGACENASVYTHGNAFIILALLERGQADEALKIYNDILPGNPNRPVPAQPNVFINGYDGPWSDNQIGQPGFPWTTGSAAWMHFCITDFMLGIRRTYEGIRIKPCLPSSWERVKITRKFRDTTYNIELLNPSKIENPSIKSILFDGKEIAIDNTLIIDGKEHQIIVTLSE